MNGKRIEEELAGGGEEGTGIQVSISVFLSSLIDLTVARPNLPM